MPHTKEQKKEWRKAHPEIVNKWKENHRKKHPLKPRKPMKTKDEKRKQANEWQRQKSAKRREWLVELKKIGCRYCPEKHLACMQFHHINPKEKLFDISEGIEKRAMEMVFFELAKCEVICGNCHAKFHWNERNSEKILKI